MESSYQKLDDDGEIRSGAAVKTNRKSAVLVSVVAATTVLLIVLVFTAVGIVLGTTLSPRPITGLKSVTNTPNELRGQYYQYTDSGTSGITFHCTVNKSFVYLSITTNDGEAVVQMLNSLNTSMTMFGMDNRDFLVMESTADGRKLEEYFIPKNTTKLVESMMRQGKNMSEDVLRLMDNETVSETRWFSLQKLVMSNEAILITKAVEALGNNTTNGDSGQYKAARVLYMLALTLSRARASEGNGVTPTPPYNHETKKYATHIGHRQSQVRCSSNGAVCERNTCPFRKYDNRCFGMCGPGCHCWHFVCGDCCVHQYCLTHDECCATQGFYTFKCFSVAYKVVVSKCTDTYSC